MAAYAQHSGRTQMNIHDAVLALDELGVSMSELSHFAEAEGKDMRKYVVPNREASEISAILHRGTKRDHSDVFSIKYQRLPSPALSDVDDAQNGDEESSELDHGERELSLIPSPPYTPELPPSPLSNASPGWHRDWGSPPRKRPRRGSPPPDHIPDFFPPFPSESSPSPLISPTHPLPATSAPAPGPTQVPALLPGSVLPEQEQVAGATATIPVEQPAIQIDPAEPDFIPPAATQPRATSDYFTSVPYDESSLSSLPYWQHLPELPQSRAEWGSYSMASPVLAQSLATPASSDQSQPELIKAFQLLASTESTLTKKSNNPARHKLALELMKQHPMRYFASDSMFGVVQPNPPRMPVQVVPTHPVTIEDRQIPDPNRPKPVLPPAAPRPVAPAPVITTTTYLQGGRIPSLAKGVVSAPVHSRVTRLIPPPVQNRPSGGEMLHGKAIPAPWNGSAAAQAAAPNVKNLAPSDPTKKTLKLGKPEPAIPQPSGPPPLADAVLYATWDWTAKGITDPPARRRGTLGSESISTGVMGPPTALPTGRRGRSAARAGSITRGLTPGGRGWSASPAFGDAITPMSASPSVAFPSLSSGSSGSSISAGSNQYASATEPLKTWRLTLPKPPGSKPGAAGGTKSPRLPLKLAMSPPPQVDGGLMSPPPTTNGLNGDTYYSGENGMSPREGETMENESIYSEGDDDERTSNPNGRSRSDSLFPDLPVVGSPASMTDALSPAATATSLDAMLLDAIRGGDGMEGGPRGVNGMMTEPSTPMSPLDVLMEG